MLYDRPYYMAQANRNRAAAFGAVLPDNMPALNRDEVMGVAQRRGMPFGAVMPYGLPKVYTPGYLRVANRSRLASGFATGSGFGRFSSFADSPVGGTSAGPADTQSVTAVSDNGWGVVTSTSPGGAVSTTAAPTTPSSAVKKAVGYHKGALGFLLWAQSAMPPQIAKAILQAAQSMSWSYQANGGLGVFGDGPDDNSTGLTLAPMDYSNTTISSLSMPTDINVDPSTYSSDAPASAPWAAQISSIISNTAQQILSPEDYDTVNSVAQTNLQRAQQGQAPLTTDLSSTATSASTGSMWLIGGGVVVLLLLMSMRS